MKVLIVDDDRTLADLLAFTMRRSGFEPIMAFSAPEAIRVFEAQPVDVVILDVNMPGEPGLRDGFDVCQQIRKTSDVPIILLTVRDDEEDVVSGLSMGADDYVLKPFSPRQLVARVKSVLRRSSPKGHIAEEPFTFGEIKFDPNRREFLRPGGSPETLTRLEARLLETLMLNAGQILPSENIISHVWGPDGGSTEMLRQLVRRLRMKIELDPTKPELIQNLPGIGYGFKA